MREFLVIKSGSFILRHLRSGSNADVSTSRSTCPEGRSREQQVDQGLVPASAGIFWQADRDKFVLLLALLVAVPLCLRGCDNVERVGGPGHLHFYLDCDPANSATETRGQCANIDKRIERATRGTWRGVFVLNMRVRIIM